jgi:hypothetical protein
LGSRSGGGDVEHMWQLAEGAVGMGTPGLPLTAHQLLPSWSVGARRRDMDRDFEGSTVRGGECTDLGLHMLDMLGFAVHGMMSEVVHSFPILCPASAVSLRIGSAYSPCHCVHLVGIPNHEQQLINVFGLELRVVMLVSLWCCQVRQPRITFPRGGREDSRGDQGCHGLEYMVARA